MAKFWTPTAKGRKTLKPDLYEGLRAFARQQKDIVAAAKEEDLRIQQRNEQWDKSQKGTESNVLENRKLLQEAENEKFRTRAIAITNRRDTEVDRLKGEAKIAEKRAKDLQALTPKLAKSITDVATTGYQLADLHYGTKEWNEKDANGITDLLLQTQIFAVKKGTKLTKQQATQLKLDAHKRGDKVEFDYVSEKERINWARAQELAGNHFKKNFNEIVNFFERDIDQSGFKVTKNNIDEIYGLRAEELIQQYGFDPSSIQAIEIRRALKNRGSQQKFKIVTLADTEKRKEKFRLNKEHFLGSPEGEVGEAILNSWITDQLEINWTFNPRTNEYDPKPVDARLKLREATQTVGKVLAIEDRYQNIGGTAGEKLFKQEFYERRLPAKKGEKPEYNHKKFPEDWEIYRKAYWDEQKKRANNRKGIVQSDGEALITKVERLTNPDIPLLEGEERINPTDTSEGGGFDKLVEMYKRAPTPEARSFIGSKIDYTFNKSANYSLEDHKALVEADESGDPAGYMFLVNQIKHKETREKYAAKYENAALYRDADKSFDTDLDWAKDEVDRKTGSNASLGITQMKGNHEKMVYELRTYLQWYKTNPKNIKRFKDEFDGNAREYHKEMEKEVSIEFQDPNSKRFPVIQVGGTRSLLGQKEILFPQFISDYVDEKQKPKTMADYRKKLTYSDQVVASPQTDWRETTTQSLPNIADLIKNGDLLTDAETNEILRGIEMGGGAGNYINIKSELQELADMHPYWTARDMVNEHLKAQGHPHRLPPDRHTLLRWSGYEHKKPKARNVKGIDIYRNFIQALEGKMPENINAENTEGLDTKELKKTTKGDGLRENAEGKVIGRAIPDYLLGDFDLLLNRNKTYVPGKGSIGGIL